MAKTYRVHDENFAFLFEASLGDIFPDDTEAQQEASDRLATEGRYWAGGDAGPLFYVTTGEILSVAAVSP